MSTRANIIIKDEYNKLFFYRHSDGYPSGTLPTLQQFVDMINSGRIRRDLQQSAGWLILIGANEYKGDQPNWKVGAYEPTTGIHGDIEYLYVIDLSKSGKVTIDIIEDNFQIGF